MISSAREKPRKSTAASCFKFRNGRTARLRTRDAAGGAAGFRSWRYPIRPIVAAATTAAKPQKNFLRGRPRGCLKEMPEVCELGFLQPELEPVFDPSGRAVPCSLA